MNREETKEVTDPGIDEARLEWLLRCEAAIKSMAEQFLCPKTSPEQLVNDILGDRCHA